MATDTTSGHDATSGVNETVERVNRLLKNLDCHLTIAILSATRGDDARQ